MYTLKLKTIVNRDDGYEVQVGGLDVPAPWINSAEGQTVPVPVGVIIVQHTQYCGKDLGLTFYVNSENAPKWLEG